LMDTSELAIFHGLEMSREPWAYHWPVLSRCWRKLSSISNASRSGAPVAAVRSTAKGLIDTFNWLYIRWRVKPKSKVFIAQPSMPKEGMK
ncbi:hypothetical protein, partial [Xanthomonas sp. GPE 39]|uniref:hypothetical protein n=1 Tax=Xanthomonas sp. GPE 39 TaxID=1583099 RepID=UPI001F22CB52